ncbi:ABC transporter substrate-binding protein [Cohnella sp. JJ-181]|uniref:ABC transporter substrate-binding protein n=1 Tax=Cohnella rhizoplanae TaxID=2974897 RepID=UPI0022FF9F69|nr:ABC transporter substrate-binding protein [Cohnella sp. JJ-181]CAI6084769.1 hypothetical protein COHCIP112018_04449 [Cohnella sp. JJ-181]
MKKIKFRFGLQAACLLLFLPLAACGGNSGSGGSGGANANGTGTNGTSAGEVSQTGTALPGGSSAEAGGEAPAVGAGGKKKIVFASFWPDEKFKEAKKKYEAAHPNIEIELQDVQTDDAHLEAEIEKFVTTTNAAMMAGKGPDMLQMDLLAADSYVKHKLLADIGAMMDRDPDFPKQDYFSNILDNVRVGKSLYSLPLSFFLSGLAGDEAAIASAGVQIDDKKWSWDDFANTAKQLIAAKGPYSSVLATSGPEFLLADMVQDNYRLFIDEASGTAKFESASFTGLMNQVKTMCEAGVVNSQGIAMVPGAAAAGAPSANCSGRGAYFEDVQINSPWDYLVTLREHGEHVRLYAKPHAQTTADGGYFRTYRNVAINASSKVQAEAWDFIKFMMEDEIGNPPETAGIPINKKAFAQQVQQLKQAGTVKAYEEGPLHGMSFPVDAEMLDRLEAYVEGAIHPVRDSSDKVWELVKNEAVSFFAGQKSAEAVAKLIQNKVTTYLNE